MEHKLSKKTITVKGLKASPAEISETWQTNNIAQVIYHSELHGRQTKTISSSGHQSTWEC